MRQLTLATAVAALALGGCAAKTPLEADYGQLGQADEHLPSL